MSNKKSMILNVNGNNHQIFADLDEPLLWVLRDDLGLTGTKFGCGTGECGACSVLIDGEAKRSCRYPVAHVAAGQEIITIEGLGTAENLSELQKAFIKYSAFCCGFCTPGMLITATGLLNSNPNPTHDEIVAAMDNNLCRCGSYMHIVKAIESVVKGY